MPLPPTIHATGFPLPPKKRPDPNWANDQLGQKALKFYDNTAVDAVKSELKQTYDELTKTYNETGWDVANDDIKKMSVVKFLHSRTKQGGGKTFRKKRSSKKSRRNRLM